MARYRKHSMCSALALAVGLASLAACGGGGGRVSFIPLPPQTPTPTPSPQTLAIGPASQAIVPNAGLFPVAVVGGPTITAHSTTMFPLLQTVVTVASPGLVADTATMTAGATLEFESSGGESSDFRLSVPELGFSAKLNWVVGGYYCYDCPLELMGNANGQSVGADLDSADASGLSWTTYGTWYAAGGAVSHSAFVTGYKTPEGSVPTTGTATYQGSTVGYVYAQPIAGSNGMRIYGLTGNASLQANFGSGSITGSLTNMIAGAQPWNSVSLVGAISGGSFSGTSAATSAPGNPLSLLGSATGTLAGMFFGPAAQELGAVWTLHDGTATAIGAIGAKTGP